MKVLYRKILYILLGTQQTKIRRGRGGLFLNGHIFINFNTWCKIGFFFWSKKGGCKVNFYLFLPLLPSKLFCDTLHSRHPTYIQQKRFNIEYWKLFHFQLLNSIKKFWSSQISKEFSYVKLNFVNLKKSDKLKYFILFCALLRLQGNYLFIVDCKTK